MNNEIKVSVCCLAYNHEKYIRKTLDGFVNQITNFNYEILINDDASTDETKKIIEEYQKKYPNVINAIYQKNNLYSQEINITTDILVPMAKGKYLSFCEGDDYWCDNKKLQKQYEALESNKNCSICVHRVQFCTEDGQLQERSIPAEKCRLNETRIINRKEVSKLLFEDISYPFHFSSYFVRREIFNEEYTATNWCEKPRDIHRLQSALLIGDFYYINQIMSVRRRDVPGSWTLRQKSKGIDRKAEILAERMEENLSYNKFTKNIYNEQIMRGIINSLPKLEEYKKSEAKKFIKKHNIRTKTIIKNSTTVNLIKIILLKYSRNLYFLIKRQNNQ